MKLLLNKQTGMLCRAHGVEFYRHKLVGFTKERRQELIDKGHFLCSKDRAKKKSNVGGFHSAEIYQRDWDTFESGKWLVASIQKALNITLRMTLNHNIPHGAIEVTNSWYMINKGGRGDWNIPHTHPGSFFSGAMYLAADPLSFDNGNFLAIVENKSIRSLMQDPADAQLVEYWPIEGELLLFPSSLLHMSTPHNGITDRVMISFNTKVVPYQV